jgi:hypothetical protein
MGALVSGSAAKAPNGFAADESFAVPVRRTATCASSRIKAVYDTVNALWQRGTRGRQDLPASSAAFGRWHRRGRLLSGGHFTGDFVDCVAESRHGDGLDDSGSRNAIGILGLVRPDTAVAARSTADLRLAACHVGQLDPIAASANRWHYVPQRGYAPVVGRHDQHRVGLRGVGAQGFDRTRRSPPF